MSDDFWFNDAAVDPDGFIIARAHECEKGHCGRSRYHDSESVPYNPNIVPVDPLALWTKLGLGQDDDCLRKCKSSVLANASYVAMHGTTHRVFYSRDCAYYPKLDGFAPAWFTRTNMVNAVEQLEQLGLLEHHPTRASPRAKLRSSFRPTSTLLQVGGLATLDAFSFVSVPEVIVRQGNGRAGVRARPSLTSRERAELVAIEADVREQNEFLAGFHVTLRYEGAELLANGLIKAGAALLNPRLRSYRRVFNGSLHLGGRWYGPWWQSIPSRLRAGLLIDGSPTVELDFSACQLRLMMCALGQSDPLGGRVRVSGRQGDLYAINGVDRDVVKLALLIMINAKGRERAEKALMRKLEGAVDELSTSNLRASEILDLVRQAFPSLDPLWFSGIGLRLQRVDADICARVQRAMRERGIPALSIHDAFIVPTDARDELESEMEAAFASTSAYASSVLKMKQPKGLRRRYKTPPRLTI